MTSARAVTLRGATLIAAAAMLAALLLQTAAAAPTVRVLVPPLEMPGLDRSRTLRVYLPPSYESGRSRYPVIYMHDGQNLFDDATAYAGEWGVDEAMDDIALRCGFEAIVVGIDNGGERRMNELSPWPNPQHGQAEGEAYLRFITDVVKPFIDRSYRTRPQPTRTAIIGSSMGGLASHYAILARPDVFGLAGIFSPSYWFSKEAFALARSTTLPATARVYLYVGGREGDSAEPDALAMHDLWILRNVAPDRVAITVEDQAEHNEAAWRAAFPPAVVWLFGLGCKLRPHSDDDAAARSRPQRP